MSRIVVWFVKITGWLPQLLYFRKKVTYIGKKEKVRGKTLIISNHKSLMDYALYMFTFPFVTLRTLTAEVIYNKGKLMAWFIKKLGCIRVDRDSYNFSFLDRTIDILNDNGTVLMFPESRLPDSDKMLEFKSSFVYIALESGAPILPVFTNGSYGKKKRARAVIGEKIYLNELYDKSKSEEENIKYLTEYVRNYVLKLGESINEK
jgi:1-acyl-sn-glycerol-3-phosphate acyltransferase